MAGTFTNSVGLRQGGWVFWFTLEGFGRRINATTTATREAFRLTTQHPFRHGYGSNSSDQYLTALLPNIRTVGESINLRNGTTQLGTIELNLTTPSFWNYDGIRTDKGWGDDPITNMMAVFGPAHSTHTGADGSWKLASAMTATATTVTLADRTGLASGDALWIEKEAVILTATPGGTGAGTISVVRGQYGTTAVEHFISGPRSEGIFYDRIKFLRGRKIRLYAQLFEDGVPVSVAHPYAGARALLPESEARLIWHGTLDDWEYPAGGPIRFACKPNMGRLDRAVGRDMVNTTVDPTMVRQAEVRAGDVDYNLSPKYPNPYTGENTTWDYPVINGSRTFYARWDKELVLAANPENNTFVTVTERKLWDTVPSTSNKEVKFHDVLTTAPAPYSFFSDENGEVTTHPVDIILALLTSTGTYDGTPSSGTNGAWDTLPANWGAAFPIADINLETFRSLKGRSGGVSYSRLMLGWDGKPIPLRDFITKNILAPMGWFLYEGVGEDGDTGLSLGTISDQYPRETVATIDEGDIVQGTWRMQGQLAQTLSTQTFSFDLDLESGTYKQVRILRRPEVLARYPDDDAEISYDVPGVSFGTTGSAVMEGRANNFAEWFSTPLPLVSFVLRLSRIEVSVTEKVLITMPDVLNPFTGTRGLVERAAIVLSAQPNFEGGNQTGINMTCLLIPERNTGLWGPCGIIRDDDGANTYTLETNEFTEADGPDNVPARDALAFNIDDHVMLLDRFGEVKSTNTVDVSTEPETAGANTLTLDGAFTLAAGAVVEPGDMIVYVHYSTSSSAAPKAGWSTEMKCAVAQADDTDNLLPNGDAAYQYGN